MSQVPTPSQACSAITLFVKKMPELFRRPAVRSCHVEEPLVWRGVSTGLGGERREGDERS